EVMRQIEVRRLRTMTARNGSLYIFGEDLKKWYDELRAAESTSRSVSQRPNSPTTQQPSESVTRHPSSVIPPIPDTPSPKPRLLSAEDAADLLGWSVGHTKRI